MTAAATIAGWLPRARWFAGKHAAVTAVSIHDSAALPGTGVTLALVDVAVDDAVERYVIPLADGIDAALSPGFAGWLAQTVLDGTTLATDRGAFRGHPVGRPGLQTPSSPADTTVDPLGGDASNTSLLVAHGRQHLAIKLLRRCREGIQPEVEVGTFLTRDAGWRGTPQLRGWLDYVPTHGEPIAVATVHDFAAGGTSAWDHLQNLFRTGGLAGVNRPAILGVVAILGRVTAEMHRALASRPDISAFAPVEPTPADMQTEAKRMAAHAASVFERAEELLATLPPRVAADVRALLSRRDTIVASLRRIVDLESTAALIRVHSDYHLGQVLVREPGPEALVIDFEGEPGRPLAERRRKTSVFKDIAGMCRSFDYLLRHVATSEGHPYRPTDLHLLEATFLDAYRMVAWGHAWWPADAATADALLAVYKLDKVLYELAYELSNRPDWVEVPLAALVER